MMPAPSLLPEIFSASWLQSSTKAGLNDTPGALVAVLPVIVSPADGLTFSSARTAM